jgi:dTMP kinase
VVCDRFADSTRVYQGVLGHVDPRLIRRLEKITVGETRPDLTIVLDLPAQIGLARAQARRGPAHSDRFESESGEFHERLRDAFRHLAVEEPDRCVLIEADAPADDVAERVWAAVHRKLDPATAPLAIEGAAP